MPWADLRRLEECCRVEVCSILDPHGRFGWRMTIAPSTPAGQAGGPPTVPAAGPIVIEAAEFREVVIKGIAEAKRQGLIP